MIAYVKYALSQVNGAENKDSVLADIIVDETVPPSISSYILHGILMLSPMAIRVLYVASVHGMEFDFVKIACIAGIPTEDTLNVLQELVHNSFIRLNSTSGNYCFDQPAVRDAIYADLPPAYRDIYRNETRFSLQ